VTTSRPWPEGHRPDHDPVAEDMDLLTHQEAAARFFDEIEGLRAEEAELVGANGDHDRLPALRRRIADLEAAIARITARRTPKY
jgi:hypothetical protein